MAFTLLPINPGDTITAAQFNEARSAVLERRDTIGRTDTMPFILNPGDVLKAEPSLPQINGLRDVIENLANAFSAYVNPATEKEWFDLGNLDAFFTAAGIGDGTDWTRVPARKGGLTVSSRLIKGDVVFAEHINEIRLAVLVLDRMRFPGFRSVGFNGFIKGPTGNVTGPVWVTVRAAAIAAAQSPISTPGLSGQQGFNGGGNRSATPPNDFTASVRIGQRVDGFGFGTAPTGTAPTPFSYANVTAFVKHFFAAPIFNGAPPPMNARRVGYQIPSFAGVPTSFNFGVTWFVWDAPTLADETIIFTGLSAAALPTGVGTPPDDLGTQLSIALADTASDRTAWATPPLPPPPASTGSEQRANVLVERVHADITNFVFQ